jgi:hypothetical protein
VAEHAFAVRVGLFRDLELEGEPFAVVQRGAQVDRVAGGWISAPCLLDAPPQGIAQLDGLLPGAQRRRLTQQRNSRPDVGVAVSRQFPLQAHSDTVGGPDLLKRVVHARDQVPGGKYLPGQVIPKLPE